MDLEAFTASLAAPSPPQGLGRPLEALWHEAKGAKNAKSSKKAEDAEDGWDRAHRLVQADDSEAGAWVHAYLHRVEGDAGNAAYWYRRARRPVAEAPTAEEWREIAEALLARRGGAG
jgi:hypothetical protein